MSVELYARILKSWHIKTPPWKADQKQPPEVFYKKKLLQNIWQYSQENTYVGVSSQ